MKISYFETARYMAPETSRTEWPVPPSEAAAGAGAQVYAEMLERLCLVESLGFDWVSVSEHHYSPRILTPNPMVAATYIAAHVRTLKIAVLGPIVPQNNPVRIAEELAMLDNFSNGRLVVGLLRGTTNEYLTYDLNPEEARDRTTEGMELILKAWTEPQPFGWQGRHFEFRTVSVWPRPLQQPYPPTYVLGTSRESCEFAASHHLGLGVSFAPFHVVRQATDYYRQQCALHAWEPGEDDILYRANILVGATEEQAQEQLAKLPSEVPFPVRQGVREELLRVDSRNRAGTPITANVGGVLPTTFVGNPDAIVEQIKRARDELGAGVLDLSFRNAATTGPDGLAQSLELFADRVLERVRAI